MVKIDLNSTKKQVEMNNNDAYARRVVIIGAGITGLSAAHKLVELSRAHGKVLRVLVLEKSSRIGGVISSRTVDDCLIEEGPDSFITTKKWALDLIERTALYSDLLEPKDKTRKAFVYTGGKLEPLPEGFIMGTPTKFSSLLSSSLFTWKGKIRMALERFVPPRAQDRDESVAGFIGRRFGTEAFERVVQPLIGGIYSSDPNNLSMRATMPQFMEMETKYGSLIKGMRKLAKMQNGASGPGGGNGSQFLSLKSGMQNMVDYLASELPENSIRLNSDVTRVVKEKEGWTVELSGGESIGADALIVALPTNRAASLIEGFDPDLAGDLGEIEYSSSAIINLAYRKEDLTKDISGSGFVVPSKEGIAMNACTYSSMKFTGRAPDDRVLFRCYVGESLNPESYTKDDGWLIGETHKILSGIFGITSEPILKQVKRNEEVMPVYSLGHLDRVARIWARADKYPQMELAGNGYYGVGIPDCVHSGETAAERIFAGL